MLTKFRRRITPYLEKLIALKYVFLFIVLVALAFFFGPTLFTLFDRITTVPRVVTSVFLNPGVELKERDNGVNVLLLGIAGGAHEGATLTDTIIFAHIDQESKETVLVSIPRDLWAPVISSKVNAAYEFGEQKQKDGGLALAKATISDILNQPVHYALRIDFSGFIQIVDLVGGLEIDVERAFDDYNYPIAGKVEDTCGKSEEEVQAFEATSSAAPTIIPLNEVYPCRVEHLHFARGLTHMDGEATLKYVRSRQAIGEEGTDFARSRRQQKVLVALRGKLLSAGVLLNPIKLIQLASTLGKSIDTDIKTSEYDDFVKLAQKMKGTKIKTVVIDQGDEEKERHGLLINPPLSQYGAWVLTPRTGDFREIQDYIVCELKNASCPIPTIP